MQEAAKKAGLLVDRTDPIAMDEAVEGTDFTSADGKEKLKQMDFDLETVPSGASMEFNVYIDAPLGLLAGGITFIGNLGSSPYLYKHLQVKYRKRKIVIQSSGFKQRTAICRGAIFKGFLDWQSTATTSTPPVSVISIITRQSLGIRYETHFEKVIPHSEDMVWDEYEGTWKAVNQMQWYLRKADNVFKAKSVRHNFHRLYATKNEFEESTTRNMTIRQCDDDDPPLRLSSSVKTLCTLKFSMQGITYYSLQDYVGENRRKLKNFVFSVEMVLSGASNKSTIYYQGRKLGARNLPETNARGVGLFPKIML
ncbi:hypothetical protein BBP40_009911 [Aspergillus hancockii]|nr:hypothetical protein BBP40_009911 [Aspergillus hancockii]